MIKLVALNSKFREILFTNSILVIKNCLRLPFISIFGLIVRLIDHISNRRYASYTIILIAFLFFFAFKYQDLYLGFWNDEVYSLQHFVFVPWSNVFNDYHVPNNHILFNAINKLYYSLIGIHDLATALRHPEKLRMLFLIYVFVCFTYMFKLISFISNRKMAAIGLTILIGTIPFLNYSLQARGYMLSTSLVAGLLYHLYAYLHSCRWFHLIVLSIYSFALAYISPSNYLFLLSIGVVVLLQFIISKEKKRRLFKCGIAMLLGIGLSLWAYAPIFDAVFNNEYVVTNAGNEQIIVDEMRVVFPFFLSGRFILIPFIALMFLLVGFRFKKYQLGLWAALLFFIPFVFCVYRPLGSPMRVFAPANIFFVLFFTLGIYALIDVLQKPRLAYLACIIFIPFTIINNYLEIKSIHNKIAADLKTTNSSQDFYINYYLHGFHPNKAIDIIKKAKPHTAIYIHKSEAHDMPAYLEANKIKFTSQANFSSFFENEPTQAIIITSQLSVLQKTISKQSTSYKLSRLNNNLDYFNVVLVEKK